LECRVAIVDDDPRFRRALGRLIRAAGFQADAYGSGAEFLDAASRSLPDCVVLDLEMPGVNGFDVQERMAEHELRVPVIVVTGYDTPEAEARALKGGARAYLRKPVDEALLLNAIRRSLIGDQAKR